MKNTWITVLNNSNKQEKNNKLKYPELDKSKVQKDSIINKIITQKLASYKKYNNVNASVFLRNIQVYFARQKWLTDTNISKDLKNYYLESLVQFCTTLLESSNLLAIKNNHVLIRPKDILNDFTQSKENIIKNNTYGFARS